MCVTLLNIWSKYYGSSRNRWSQGNSNAVRTDFRNICAMTKEHSFSISSKILTLGLRYLMDATCVGRHMSRERSWSVLHHPYRYPEESPLKLIWHVDVHSTYPAWNSTLYNKMINVQRTECKHRGMHLWLTDCTCQQLCTCKQPCICTQVTEWPMDRYWRLLILQNEDLEAILLGMEHLLSTNEHEYCRSSSFYLRKSVLLNGKVPRRYVPGLTKRQGGRRLWLTNTPARLIAAREQRADRPAGPTRAALSLNWKKSKLPQRMRHPQTNK